MLPCIRRARAPRDLAAVTTIRAEREADPRSVGAAFVKHIAFIVMTVR